MRIMAEFDTIDELFSFAARINSSPEAVGAMIQLNKNKEEIHVAKSAPKTKAEVKEIAQKAIAETFDKAFPEPETPSAEPEVISQEVKAEEPKSETAKAIEEVFEGKVQEVPQGKDITKEDVRAVFATMLKANLGQDAKILTGKYGAKKVPDIKPEDYAAIHKEAMALIDRVEANEKAAEGASA